MQAIPRMDNTAADEHRSTEVNIGAAPTENGVRNAKENTSNVETSIQPPEHHLNLVRDELEQFISPCFVHLVRGKIIYCHITMQIEQQRQITREKENFPPHILKEIPTNNIFKSLFNDDKSAKAAAGKKYITPKQLLTAGKTRSSRKR